MLERGIQVLVPLATKADEARKVRETAFPDGIHIREMVRWLSPLSWSFREQEANQEGGGKFYRCKSKLVTGARAVQENVTNAEEIASPVRPLLFPPIRHHQRLNFVLDCKCCCCEQPISTQKFFFTAISLDAHNNNIHNLAQNSASEYGLVYSIYVVYLK